MHSVVPPSSTLQERFKKAIIDQNIYALQVCLRPSSGDALKVDMNALCFNKPYIAPMNALMYASDKGYVEIVKVLLAAGAEMNQVDSDGMTALIYASGRGHLEIVQALLAAGAEVNQVDSDGRTALMMASMKGHVEFVQALLAAGAVVDKAASNGLTALMYASASGHLEVVKVLLAAGAVVNQESSEGKTALIYAAENNHYAVVREILDNTDDPSWPKVLHQLALLKNQVNMKNTKGGSLLISAIGNQNILLFDTLLQLEHLDVDQDLGGCTPLMYAIDGENEHFVQRLIEKKANIHKTYAEGWNALMRAVKKGNLAIVKFLLQQGADVLAQTSTQKTALHLAVKAHHYDITRELLLKFVACDKDSALSVIDAVGKSIHSMQDDKGCTFLMDAIATHNMPLATLLLQSRHMDLAVINAQNNTGQTALMLAAQAGHYDGVQCLIDHGADIDIIDGEGKTAKDFAHGTVCEDILGLSKRSLS